MEGTIVKVDDFVCEVDFNELGSWCIRYHNLIKRSIDVGMAVKLSESIGSLTEIKRVSLGNSSLSTVATSKVQMAGRDGMVVLRHRDSVFGESVDVWLEELELLIILDPNSVLNNTDSTVYSCALNASAPHQIFNEFSDVEQFKVQQRPPMAYMYSKAHYDLHNDTPLHSNFSVLHGAHSRKQYHPSEYFQLGRFRPPGRLPWFGVRVAVLVEYLQIHVNPIVEYGEVWDIQPKPDNVSSFVVLVGTMDEHGARSARWFDYSHVRRLDNNGPLHTVSTYTGRPPWIGLPVKAIHGPFKDRGVGTIQDVTADPESHSGLSILVEFTLGYVVGKRARLHIDYDLVCRADTGRFIHDTKWPDLPKNSYFQFKMGYFPE